MLKFLKNLLRLWCISLPNLKILLRNNNKPTLFLLFLSVIVMTSISNKHNVSLVHVWKSIKKNCFLLQKKNSALLEYTCLTNYKIGWEKSEIITTNQRYHQRLCLENWHIDSTHAPLNGDNGGVTSWRLFTPRQKKGSWLMSV